MKGFENYDTEFIQTNSHLVVTLSLFNNYGT